MSVKSIVVNEDVRDEVRQARRRMKIDVRNKRPLVVFWILHAERVRQNAIERAKELCEENHKYGYRPNQKDRRFALNSLCGWKKMYRDALLDLKSHDPFPLP